MTDYITTANFRAAIKDDSTLDPDLIAQSITSASRRVDQLTGRQFDKASSATARLFDAETEMICRVDDIADTTGLLVEVDWGTEGLYATPWTLNTDFILTPENQRNKGLPWPYTTIQATTHKVFPPPFRRKRVRVTAKWGWPSIPDLVITATTLIAVGFYKRPEAPFGIAGISDFGAVRVREDPAILELLYDYTTGESKFLMA